jgi:hypothetical protein
MERSCAVARGKDINKNRTYCIQYGTCSYSTDCNIIYHT